MSLRLGDVAPDFTADTTQGTVKFHDWIGSGWAILFSHRATSRRCARPSWATSRGSSPSSTSAM